MGVVSKVGYVAKRSDLMQSLAMSYAGHDEIDEKDILFMMEEACFPQRDANDTLSAGALWESQWMSALTTPAQVAGSGLAEDHAWVHKPMFRNRFQMDKDPTGEETRDGDVILTEMSIRNAGSLAEAATVIAAALADRLSRSLMVPLADIDIRNPVYKYGFDSLVAVELQHWFSEKIKATILVLQTLSGVNLLELSALAAEKSEYFHGGLDEHGKTKGPHEDRV